MIIFKRKRIKLSKITIPKCFEKTPPKPEKLIKKTINYINTGELSPICVSGKNYVLVDGYCSYLIRKACGEEKVKIVYVDERKSSG